MIGGLTRGIPVLLLLFLGHIAYGGGLQDREKEVTERSASKKTKTNPEPDTDARDQDAATSSFGSGTYPSSRRGDRFPSGFLGWLIAAPFQYRTDDPASVSMRAEDGWGDGSSAVFPQHFTGQPTLPYVRFDYHYQFVDNDQPTDVHDGRLELGYKIFAFHGRMTKYIQDDGFALDLRQYYAVLRYGGCSLDLFPANFEIGIGLGVVQHTGDVQDDTSGAITVPLKFYPTEWCGVEFRPAWYHWQEISIADYDLSVSLGLDYMQLRAGYRWLWDNGVVDVQSGPYAGISISF